MRKTMLARSAIACTALSLVLTACGGGSDDGAAGGGGGDAEAGQAAAPETWPLTGLPVDGGAKAPSHPALVVKMDNTDSSAPQIGLGKADLVVEELVEGGITRLAAFYYSQVPGNVGPVRSLRASDIGIVSPAGAQIVTSGGAPPTVSRVNEAGIKFYGEGGPGFYRDSGRRAPYNLMNDLTKVAGAAKGDVPDDYLPWGDAKDLPKGKPAGTIAANFGSRVTQWKFQKGGYVNTNSNAAQGDQFEADTVLALRVEVVDAGYRDPAGNFVPESKFEGRGDAVLFHGGKAIKATWEKDGAKGTVTLSTAKGELTVPAGKTWIELVPTDKHNGSVNYR